MIAFISAVVLLVVNDEKTLTLIETYSQAAAALLSLTALIISFWVAFRQQRLSRWQLRLHREDHVIDWARKILVLLASVEEKIAIQSNNASALPTLFSELEFIEYRSRLSALIDEGRLYFPNIQDSVKGRDKDKAYQGHRQPILDTLVDFYDTLKLVMQNPATTEQSTHVASLNKLRRQFISEVQTKIDPRSFNKVRA